MTDQVYNPYTLLYRNREIQMTEKHNIPSASRRPLGDGLRCGPTLRAVSRSLPVCTGDWRARSVSCPWRSSPGSAWLPSARCPGCSCAQSGNMTWWVSLSTMPRHDSQSARYCITYHNLSYDTKILHMHLCLTLSVMSVGVFPVGRWCAYLSDSAQYGTHWLAGLFQARAQKVCNIVTEITKLLSKQQKRFKATTMIRQY